MTLDEIKWIVAAAAKFGFSGIVAGLIVYALIRQYLGGYLPEKGKNLATKEDIEKITKLVKGVEHQYNVLIKQMEAKQQLRMAAVDKRLQVHQEAFAHWHAVFEGGAGNDEPLKKFAEWYNNNCLYLEPDVRKEFADFFSRESMQKESIRLNLPPKQVMDTYDEMFALPNALFKAVQLPGLSELEKKVVTGDI
jgi:hypothetical protein